MSKNDWWLYAIECGPFIKVGSAKSVKKRVKAISTGNPFPLKVLDKWQFNCPRNLEFKVHHRLKDYRTTGEWFACDIETVREAVTLAMDDPTVEHRKANWKKAACETKKFYDEDRRDRAISRWKKKLD